MRFARSTVEVMVGPWLPWKAPLGRLKVREIPSLRCAGHHPLVAEFGSRTFAPGFVHSNITPESETASILSDAHFCGALPGRHALQHKFEAKLDGENSGWPLTRVSRV